MDNDQRDMEKALYANMIQIGSIGNYYGNLTVSYYHGKYYWSIENWNGCTWEEISKDLYDALMNHNKRPK